MTTYNAEQLEPIEIRPTSRKTKPGSIELVVIHGDGDQTMIASPLSPGAGRGRNIVLRLLAANVDLDDIRIVRIPESGGRTDGLRLEPVSVALFWTTKDDTDCADRDRTEYARALRQLEPR